MRKSPDRGRQTSVILRMENHGDSAIRTISKNKKTAPEDAGSGSRKLFA
jgi:hypothetical protein